VHNTGVSIPSGDIDQLFRPFSRLPGSASHRGTGLGLYITKCIVEAHGGTLRLDQTTDELAGTTFSFDLPLQ
jgi:signal transduction histidine kinase